MAVADLQNATDDFDDAAAEVLGVNRTDLRILEALGRQGVQYPARIAALTGRSRGAITTAIDRLERAGYVRRVRDPQDRRLWRIELTAEAIRRAAEIWGLLVQEGVRMLSPYPSDELALILRFLRDARTLQEQQLARIRKLRKRTPR